MRWFPLLAAVLLLGACNQMTSTQPLFSAADAAGAPALKDGLWLTDEPDCRVDVRKPVQKWPVCARWYVVRGGEVLNFHAADRDSPAEWETMSFLLASGEPRIMQADIRGVLNQADKPVPMFMYLALTPTVLDSEGRITAQNWWMVLCGPPPLDARGKPDPAAQTKAPFAGMTLIKAEGEKGFDADCTASDRGSVRAAAVASQALGPVKADRWIRDTLP
ncbi:hypothetical protein QO010_000186 [Caulobacter ginsengisoli]|uniref:Lipoprotein n=1 Tax=Caulobacter ginsengisoli TaxID=400775 RepID=A0ABU0IKA1_9CAUL|nr:hypothetical protein [Caulobacter ginsengisoli]MDQ0462438.1 hypothetical protein [Caulobacter ginsengisoli]